MNTTVAIQNLKCGGCAHTIKTALDKLEGVSEVRVDELNNTVTFAYQTSSQYQAVTQKLKSLGYPVAEADNDLITKARSFVSCAKGRLG